MEALRRFGVGTDTRLDMLRETIAFAVANIPYYRARSGTYDVRIASMADLARLPILFRRDLLADPRAFCSSEEWPMGVSYTSSTTGGIGQPRWHSFGELDAYEELLQSPARIPDDGMALIIFPFDQGPSFARRTATHRAFVPLLNPWHYELIANALRDGWTAPSGVHRITRIVGFSPGLRILTVWLEQRGVDPRSFGVRELYGYGSIQPQAWRDRLERTWGAAYHDQYGLSEVKLSVAEQCPRCGAYHFDLPILPEVVDPLTREPITGGTGSLLLTELYPLAQLQVLLRYWTDDLVEIGPRCPGTDLGFFFRGRAHNSVVLERDGKPPLVVGALQVGEICSGLAEVALAAVPWAPWAPDVGMPRFTLRADAGTIRVGVELRFTVGLHPTAARVAEDRLRDTMLREISGLADAVRLGEAGLVVEARDPGSIADPAKV